MNDIDNVLLLEIEELNKLHSKEIGKSWILKYGTIDLTSKLHSFSGLEVQKIINDLFRQNLGGKK